MNGWQSYYVLKKRNASVFVLNSLVAVKYWSKEKLICYNDCLLGRDYLEKKNKGKQIFFYELDFL